MPGFTSVCVFLFSALALAFNSGYSLGALLLLLSSIFLLWKRPHLRLKHSDYLLLGTLFLYFFIYAANMLFHADPGREFDMPLRALLALPVLLLLLAYPPRPAAWWAGVAVGAISGAALAFWQFIIQDTPRPLAATSNAIHYGNVSMLFSMLCLCGIEWARKQSRPWFWTLLMAGGCLAGLAGSVVSGSRGGWLALPVCLCIVGLHYAKKRGKRFLLGALATRAVLATRAYSLPHSPVRERVESAINDLNSLHDKAPIYTSVGQRLELWRSALSMSGDNILLGIGRTGYMEQKKRWNRRGR